MKLKKWLHMKYYVNLIHLQKIHVEIGMMIVNTINYILNGVNLFVIYAKKLPSRKGWELLCH